jgi:hypothetical protein
MLILAVGVLNSVTGAYAAACATLGGAYCSTSTAGVRYVWDGRTLTKGFSEAGREQRTEGGKTVVYDYTLLPTCSGNRPDGVGGVIENMCLNATSCPMGEIRLTTWARRVTPPPTAWAAEGTTCVGARESWTLPELTGIAREALFAAIEHPSIQIQPKTGGLVNLPVIVSTEDLVLTPDPLPITQPFPGQITATPDYMWDFGAGATARGVGRPYDGTSTKVAGYYVQNTYPTTGSKSITLTVSWTAQLQVADQVIPLPPISEDVTAAVDVLQAKTRLVSR